MKTYILVLCAIALTACSNDSREKTDARSQGHEAAAADFARGPHDGRLLADGDFAVEITTFESGVPPEFRLYLYDNGKPLAPTEAEVRIALTRLDGETNTYTFTAQSDFLRGNGVVHEPHSFDVQVTAQRPRGRGSRWEYSSYEGRTTIADSTAASMGVETRPSGPSTLKEQLVLSGTVQADPTRVSEVRARYPGIIREVLVAPSGNVQKGAALVQIQSNESLQNYPLLAPISGTLVEHRARVGEATGTEPLFTIMDASRVWVELDVFPKDLDSVRTGQAVEVFDLDERPIATGPIVRMGTLAKHGSQSVQARVVIDNASRALRPGQFVTARVNVAQHTVEVAVDREALQKFRDFDVVFEKVGETYEVRMLELGRSDATHVEVLSGLKPGAHYVARNSYLIKADIEKSGASHDH